MSETSGRRRVVVVGGGFGGAYCAQALERHVRGMDVEVLLLDRRNYFIFYPLLVEAGTGSLEPRHAVVSIRSFLKDARFKMGDVVAIDPQSRCVLYCLPGAEEPERVTYDRLVIALGSATNLPPVPGLREHALEVKSMSDAVGLRDRAIQMLERADCCEGPEERGGLLHFIVVGANFTGVEVAGELSTFVRKAAERYRNVDPDEVRVTLVELTDRILQAIDPDLSEFAQRHMSDCGIRVFLNNSVEEIQPDSVRLSSGERLPAQTVIWTAGIAPPPLVADLPFPKDERGYLQTERDMRIAGYEDVWAIGDCAVNPGPDGSPYPPTAQHAIRQAKHAARDIAATLRGEGTRPTEIASQGSIAAIGCRGAVARVFGVKLSGFVAWWLYRTVYLLKMPGLARKVRVAIDWTMDLFFPRDYVQLRVHGSRRPAESRSGGADEALEPATSGSTP